MKPILKQILVPAASAIAGGLIVLGAIRLSPNLRSNSDERNRTKQSAETIYDDIFKKHDGIRNQFDSLFNDDLFRQNDPFDQMRKMREEMEKRMESMNIGRQHSSNPFDSWFTDRFGGGTVNDISKREDDESVYYDIKVENVNSTSINTKVENGYITITGTTEKKSGSSDGKEKNGFLEQSVFKTTFSRKFPLPEHVDQNNMQMTSEKNKIVLKFPKVKS
jgi:HSP20 family molecular chaperone IbpA